MRLCYLNSVRHAAKTQDKTRRGWAIDPVDPPCLAIRSVIAGDVSAGFRYHRVKRARRRVDVAHIDFFYFFGSGYAYLSVLRIAHLAAGAGVEVRWRPINVRPLMARNNVALKSEALKVRYMWRDIERRAAHHGLQFVKPPIWTTDPTLLANRVGIVAAQEGWCKDYTVASFRAWYLEGLPLGTGESLAQILGPLGRDVDGTIAKAETQDIADRYDAETEVALGHGVLGSPSFVVDGELFWGDDRLEEAILWAQGRHALQIGQGL